jgi:serine/threonine-protein kinase HipA
MRQLEVYVNDVKAGLLTELNPGKGYTFVYTEEYAVSDMPPVSLTLPKRKEAYESEFLFPFFTNLLPEGANRKVVCREQRIDDKDFFGMLMATVGTDMIGSVNFKAAIERGQKQVNLDSAEHEQARPKVKEVENG